MTSVDRSVPRWMPRTLVAAGLYNLTWGAFMVLLPVAPFTWAGMTPPNYPSLWQCIGMIVGVYGIGYLLAARDVIRLWPLALVGLIGKILGPIGFVWTAWRGELPWIAGLTILTNDVLWWLPLGAICLYAARRAPIGGE